MGCPDLQESMVSLPLGNERYVLETLLQYGRKDSPRKWLCRSNRMVLWQQSWALGVLSLGLSLIF